jgi:hypothetical protein
VRSMRRGGMGGSTVGGEGAGRGLTGLLEVDGKSRWT